MKHDGTAARSRAFYATVESFTAAELAAHIGKPAKTVYRSLAVEVRTGLLFACGLKGNHNRRYTVHKDVADRLDDDAKPKPLSEVGMRRKIGACLGGLSGLESLRIRCDIDPDDEDACWLWNGSMTGAKCGLPTALLPRGGTGSVQRWAYDAFVKPVLPGQIVWRGKCSNERCCNPAHLRAGSRKQWGVWLKSTRAWSDKTAYMIANRRIGAARAIVTAGVLNDITARGETPIAAAARLGVSPSSIYRARRRVAARTASANDFGWMRESPDRVSAALQSELEAA